MITSVKSSDITIKALIVELKFLNYKPKSTWMLTISEVTKMMETMKVSEFDQVIYFILGFSLYLDIICVQYIKMPFQHKQQVLIIVLFSK